MIRPDTQAMLNHVSPALLNDPEELYVGQLNAEIQEVLQRMCGAASLGESSIVLEIPPVFYDEIKEQLSISGFFVSRQTDISAMMKVEW